MRTTAALPRHRGRIVGLAYLAFFLSAILGEVLNARGLVAYGEILGVISYVCYLTVTLFFYALFKPVDVVVSFVAAIASVLGCVTGTLELFHAAPSQVSQIVFFAPYCLMIGYLIVRSVFLPRALGVLMLVAGVGWLAFLSPFATSLTSYIEGVGILAEAALMLWLLVVGVSPARWSAQRIE